MKDNWIKIIHMAKNKTGIDDEIYRAILSGQSLKSSKEIKTVEQFNEIMNAFKNLGFVYNPKNKKYSNKRKITTPEAEGMITRKQECYIKGLWELTSKKKDEKSLRAMIKRIAGCDDITFLKREYATKVILALRDIAKQEGFNPEGKEVS